MADGKVVFEITGDNSSLLQTLQETTRDIQTESSKWDNAVDDSSGNISSSLIGAFKAVTASAAFVKIAQMLLQLGGESKVFPLAWERGQEIQEIASLLVQ